MKKVVFYATGFTKFILHLPLTPIFKKYCITLMNLPLKRKVARFGKLRSDWIKGPACLGTSFINFLGLLPCTLLFVELSNTWPRPLLPSNGWLSDLKTLKLKEKLLICITLRPWTSENSIHKFPLFYYQFGEGPELKQLFCSFSLKPYIMIFKVALYWQRATGLF